MAKSKDDSVKTLFTQYLKKNGLRMSKLISSGGLFANDTYDRRTVFSVKDLNDLNKQGFGIDENMGLWVFNALFTD